MMEGDYGYQIRTDPEFCILRDAHVNIIRILKGYPDICFSLRKIFLDGTYQAPEIFEYAFQKYALILMHHVKKDHECHDKVLSEWNEAIKLFTALRTSQNNDG